MAGRAHLNQDEINHLTKKMHAGMTFAEAVADLALTSTDIDTAGLGDFETHVTTKAKQYAREHVPGPETELDVLRTLVPPTITALGAPTVAVGGDLEIIGTGFVKDVQVTIGNPPALATVKSRTLSEIVIVAPNKVGEGHDVVVTNRNGLADTFAGVLTITA